ncbi:D-aminoacyl-tRNA deacylase [Sessilibacter sp. MAH2]
MKGLIQRVTHASVAVDGEIVGEIQQGILLLLGIEKTDTNESIDKLVDKVLKIRIFSDEQGKMNNSVADINGGVLVVSQFTLVADTKKGTRPGFSSAAPPDIAEQLYRQFVDKIQQKHVNIATGIFAADMKISLLNDGPVTFMLEV